LARVTAAAGADPTTLVKCVVWDLDNTLWSGIALEQSGPPEPVTGIEEVLDTLEARGIVNAIVTRNPRSVLELVHASPLLRGHFVAEEAGWGRKSETIARLAEQLGFDVASLAFVDDDPLERAQVWSSLPDVLVLAPEELRLRLDEPPFSAEARTAEARGRAAAYRAARRRRTESARYPSHLEFLRSCEIVITLARAEPADAERIAELSVRTTQYNSTGIQYTADDVRRLLGSGTYAIGTARLRDRFGDEGLVGLAVADVADSRLWTIELLAASCRAAGREVVPAVIGWIVEEAARRHVDSVELPIAITPRNVPLRVAARAAGFETAAARADERVVFARDASRPLDAVAFATVIAESRFIA
jgi:methoxymalonate biosynthesis protein